VSEIAPVPIPNGPERTFLRSSMIKTSFFDLLVANGRKTSAKWGEEKYERETRSLGNWSVI
jgi:hypothetical protein